MLATVWLNLLFEGAINCLWREKKKNSVGTARRQFIVEIINKTLHSFCIWYGIFLQSSFQQIHVLIKSIQWQHVLTSNRHRNLCFLCTFVDEKVKWFCFVSFKIMFYDKSCIRTAARFSSLQCILE